MKRIDPDCPFCKIVAGDGEARIVFEDQHTLGFFPDSPATLGHTLVVPKSHYADVIELPPRLSQLVWASTRRTARAIDSGLKPHGINIINSVGRVATQTVFHMHVHVVPRWANDRIDDIWPPKTAAYSDSRTDDVLEDLRAEFRKVHRRERPRP